MLLGSCVNCSKKCDIHANMRKMQISYIMGHQQQTPLLTFISLTLACNSHTGRKKADQNRSISCETFLHKTKELVVGEKSGIKYAAKMKAFLV